MVGEDQVKEKHQGWIASLSNGETIFQAPSVPGQQSAWGQLQARCEEEEIYITQIQLQLYGSTLVGMANADGYTAFYERSQSWNAREIYATYQGIGSVLGDWVTCMFMNESGHVWQDLRPLADMQAHCQLKPAADRRQARLRPAMPGANRAGLQVVGLGELPERQWDDDFDVIVAWFEKKGVSHADKSVQLIAYEILADTGINIQPDEVAVFKDHLL